jgi:hypothetical protein
MKVSPINDILFKEWNRINFKGPADKKADDAR